jgi:hypothetical protein
MTQHADWLAELHRTGDWRTLADWLLRRDTYLAPSMAIFADSMRRSARTPTPRQLGLLISLRGGVEALMLWDDVDDAPTPGDSYADAAMADGDAASAAEGAKLLASMLRPAQARPATGYSPARCGWRGKSGRRKPCRAYVQRGTDRCWHHQPHMLKPLPSYPTWAAPAP